MKIKQNFLEQQDFNNIKNTVIQLYFPWYLQKGIAHPSSNDTDECYFTHKFFEYSEVSSSFYKDLKPLVQKLINGVEGKALLRIKANFYPRTSQVIEHDFHKDYDFSHKALILSLNTNNGYTKFKDGTKVESIENQAVMFDGVDEHKSTSCSDKFGRINLGINYL